MAKEASPYRNLWNRIGEAKENPELQKKLVDLLDRANEVRLPWTITALVLSSFEAIAFGVQFEAAESFEKKAVVIASGSVLVLATLFSGLRWRDAEANKIISSELVDNGVCGPGR